MHEIESLPVSFLTSVRYYWAGSVPRTHGWPLFRLILKNDGVSLAPSVNLPFLRRAPRLEARWNEFSRIERTGRGIRFIFKDERPPMVVATWRHSGLEQVVGTLCPVEFDLTLRPSTWGSV